jgi:hypothetical protein
MLQIVFLVSFGKLSMRRGCMGLVVPWPFGLAVQKVLEY